MPKDSPKLILFCTLIILMAWCLSCSATQTAQTDTPIPSMHQPTQAEETSPDPSATATLQTAPDAMPQPDTPTEVSSPTPENSQTATAVDSVVAKLESLTIDEFFEQSYTQLGLRYPENLTELNLSAEFGRRNDELNNLSDAYLRETQALEVAILEMLRRYDRDSLTPEQRISYDVYEWYLDNQVRGHAFMYHDYPLHYFLRSYHSNLDTLFTEIQPLDTRQDVEDYIARLNAVDEQVEQLMEGLLIREEMGIIPPKFIIEMTRTELLDVLKIPTPDPKRFEPTSLRVYERLARDIEAIEELTAEERQDFLDQAVAAIEESFAPAHFRLLEYQDYLIPLATDDAGVWKLPDGAAYYAYLLRRETSTDYTPEEVHQLGLVEVERIHADMRAAFSELGYAENASLSEIFPQAVEDAGYINIQSQAQKDEYLRMIEETIAEIDQRISPVFDLRPATQVIVFGGSSGGYYVPGAPDGSRPGAYHVNIENNWAARYNLQTIAYHEAIPGHHFQIATAQNLDLPYFRRDVFFNGYVEGWALYSERLAWELGAYDESPFGNIGRLQYELLRAVRLVTDTGLHAMGWTREEAQAYMDKAMNAQPGWFSHEVNRYTVLPAQATGYKIGMLKILELRQRAMDQLGEQFDLREFHNLVIGNGSLPLEILETLVDDYIQGQLGS